MDRRKLLLLLSPVLLIGLIVFLSIYYRAEAQVRAQLESEIGKAMLNIIVAVSFGIIVQVIVRDFEERRKRWLAHRDFLRTDLTEGISKLYSDAKQMRRLLRASVTDNKIDTGKYEELLTEISDIQLGLERRKRVAKAGASIGVLPDCSIASDLESMEKYLGRLVEEYEDSGHVVSKSSSISLENLSWLNDFIGVYEPSEFRSNFVHPFDSAATAVALEVAKDLSQKNPAKRSQPTPGTRN